MFDLPTFQPRFKLHSRSKDNKFLFSPNCPKALDNVTTRDIISLSYISGGDDMSQRARYPHPGKENWLSIWKQNFREKKTLCFVLAAAERLRSSCNCKRQENKRIISIILLIENIKRRAWIQRRISSILFLREFLFKMFLYSKTTERIFDGKFSMH